MPGVARLSDVCTGHGCFPSRANCGASGDVYVNGRGAHRVGDPYPSHCCGPSCHDGVAASGSGTVFVNGRPLVRISDAVSCGGTVASGSGDVFAN